jgi:hypothetical protein
MKMKGIKKGLLAGAILCCMPMLTGCSFKDTLHILWNSEDKESADESTQGAGTSNLEAANIDESVEKPTLNNELGEPVTYGLNGEAEALAIDASVSDGGTLSYQWYRNNVDSNGGGTVIDGAVEANYIPQTTEPGTIYYYVVVTNTVGDGIQLTTSATKCVTVTEEPAQVTEDVAGEPAQETVADVEGSWQQSDQGWWFQHPDGTYPTSSWEHIEGEWYSFDENGYIRKGWYQDGEKWYFFNDNGSMAHDTDVDGYHLGSDGVMQ